MGGPGRSVADSLVNFLEWSEGSRMPSRLAQQMANLEHTLGRDNENPAQIHVAAQSLSAGFSLTRGRLYEFMPTP